MLDEPTNRELKIMLDNEKQRNDDKHKEILDILAKVSATINETLVQAQKTNGRVNKHEWYFKAIWWALGAAWVVLLIGIPLLYQLLTYSIQIKIDNGIKTALSQE